MFFAFVYAPPLSNTGSEARRIQPRLTANPYFSYFSIGILMPCRRAACTAIS